MRDKKGGNLFMKKIGKLGLTIAMVLAMAIGTTATAFADTAAAT